MHPEALTGITAHSYTDLHHALTMTLATMIGLLVGWGISAAVDAITERRARRRTAAIRNRLEQISRQRRR